MCLFLPALDTPIFPATGCFPTSSDIIVKEVQRLPSVLEKNLAEHEIEPASSCFQDLHTTDWATGARQDLFWEHLISYQYEGAFYISPPPSPWKTGVTLFYRCLSVRQS